MLLSAIKVVVVFSTHLISKDGQDGIGVVRGSPLSLGISGFLDQFQLPLQNTTN